MTEHFISRSEKSPREARVFGFLQGIMAGGCIGAALAGQPDWLFAAILPIGLCVLASYLWD